MRLPKPERVADAYALVLLAIAIAVSFPTVGELVFRGIFIQDADEVVRSWYGRCAFLNPSVIPYSHLSMPGWTALLGVGEAVGRLLGLPMTMPGRLITVAAGWVCLRSAAGWVRAVGGSERLALAAVALIAASPGFFLMTLTVYPEVTLAAIAVTAFRFVAEDRLRAAAILIGWAPQVRWEGILLVLLVGAVLALRRAWRPLPWLLVPYLLYLGINAVQYGNPWTPLVFRTTPAMGTWLVLNPAVTWDLLRPALINLATLFSPLVLLGGIAVAVSTTVRREWRLALMAFGAAGLAVALFVIWHEYTVWALRVFVVPTTLALLALVGQAVTWRPRLLLGLAAAATVASAVMTFVKVESRKVPAPGRIQNEIGFHMFVRYADAAPVIEWLRGERADWIVTNHLNANLLRADPTCSMRDLPLRMGSPRVSLDFNDRFEASFGLPPGEGLVIFHALVAGVPGCTLVKRFEDAHMDIYRCGNPATPGTVED